MAAMRATIARNAAAAARSASNFSSSQVMIPPAIATGRLHDDCQCDGARNRAWTKRQSGGRFLHRQATKSEQRVYAKAVVVAASACESARLLLNSRSPSFPNGLANSSGVVGRYLTDSVGSDLAGYFPQLEKMPAHNHDGVGGMHLYMPWWRFGKKNDFLRGYHIEFGGGRDMPGVGGFDGVCEEHEGYGISLKQKCRSSYGTFIGFSGRGEMIPNENCFCELDPNVKDQWGIPVLRFHWQAGENELKMAADMQATFRSIVEAAGGTVIAGTRRHPLPKSEAPRPNGIAGGGEIIHELGTVRMGKDAKTSVLNSNCQAHDVKNLFVADAAPFVTNPDKNPTLTIMALSWRTSEYLLDQAKKGRALSERHDPRLHYHGARVLRSLSIGAVAGSVLRVIPLEAAEYAHNLIEAERAEPKAGGYVPKFFAAHQFETLQALVRDHSAGRPGMRWRD